MEGSVSDRCDPLLDLLVERSIRVELRVSVSDLPEPRPRDVARDEIHHGGANDFQKQLVVPGNRLELVDVGKARHGVEHRAIDGDHDKTHELLDHPRPPHKDLGARCDLGVERAQVVDDVVRVHEAHRVAHGELRELGERHAFDLRLEQRLNLHL
eukprot:Amastigsp_a681845_8.p2 type:complete len:155 gc:universal Amastigsp_a681845_8:184-648(+)